MGNLVVGDIILKLNGIDMSKAEKPQATSLLKGSKDAEFVIRRRTAGFAPSGYGGPGPSSQMMTGAQQQQIINQQNMMSMQNSMYDQSVQPVENDPNMQMANIMKNNIIERHYTDSDEDYHSRQRN